MTKDPYRYFRVEARELLDGLTAGVLELERAPAAPERIARLLRLAHTLKGAARVVKQPAIAELAHATESLLTGYRGATEPLPREQASELLRLIDEMTSLLKALDAVGASEARSPARAVDEPFEAVRVDVQEMDALLRRRAPSGSGPAAHGAARSALRRQR
jgi:two-component system chemotaxis sensor kinase CheA